MMIFSGSSYSGNTISTPYLENLIDELKSHRIRASPKKIYFSVWRKFNEFFLKLDYKPNNWEDRLTLFTGYLIDQNKQSQTIKSYISAIRGLLLEINVEINTDAFLLSALTKACKFKSDCQKTRLPIRKPMLNVLIQEIGKVFDSQPYLASLYSALFSTAYFGLFHIRELTAGSYPVLVTDVHIARNKKKILFVLRSLKTHTLGSRPQLIKITGLPSSPSPKHRNLNQMECFCPYQLLQNFITSRPQYLLEDEPFFCLSDNSPVKPEQLQNTLKNLIKTCGFNNDVHEVHSLRTGRASDLLKMGVSVETIKWLGRWKSNAVFTYLCTL